MTPSPVEICKHLTQKNSTYLAHFLAAQKPSEPVARPVDMTWARVARLRGLVCRVIAMRPIRRQIVSDVMRIMAGPFVIWVLMGQLGRRLGGIALFAFLSLFRNHMICMAQSLMGQRPEIPT